MPNIRSISDLPKSFKNYSVAQKRRALEILNAILRDNPEMDEGVAIATVHTMLKEEAGKATGEFVFKASVVDAAEDDGKWGFRAVASSQRIDKENARMTANALQKMVSGGPVPLSLANSHLDAMVSYAPLIGWATPRMADDGATLEFTGHLKKSHPFAASVWEDMQDEKRRPEVGFSVGGKFTVLPSQVFDAGRGGVVTEIDGVDLDHILLCRHAAAANPDVKVLDTEGDWQDAVFKAAATLARQPGGQGLGPDGNCVCSSCGHIEPHETGEACNQIKCPECGELMTREEDDIVGKEAEMATAEIVQTDEKPEDELGKLERMWNFLRGVSETHAPPAPVEEPVVAKTEEVAEVEIPDWGQQLQTDIGEIKQAVLSLTPAKTEDVVEEPADETPAEVVDEPGTTDELAAAPTPEGEEDQAALLAKNVEYFHQQIASTQAVLEKLTADNTALREVNQGLAEQVATLSAARGMSAQIPASAAGKTVEPAGEPDILDVLTDYAQERQRSGSKDVLVGQ